MVKMPHWPIPYGTQPMEQCLIRMQELLEKMNNPHHHLPPTVHVAGTNGKGSTIAFMRYILQEAGYKVHAYTSPHLARYNERILLAGKEVDDNKLHEAIEFARIAAGDMSLTFYEGTTAAALYLFATNRADILLVETGMGGRFDATNIVNNPIATLITPIALDHTEYLGNNLPSIAWHKAGIMKNHGMPCIISKQPPEVMEVLQAEAMLTATPTFSYGIDWICELHGDDQFSFIDDQGSVEFNKPSLLGAHQVLNASLAIATIQCLPDFQVTYGNIIQGLGTTRWKARLQQINTGALAAILPENFSLWVDGAHNPAGAMVLAENIKTTWQGYKVILINGRSKDRDIEGFLQPFVDVIDMVLPVKVHSEPKSEDPEVIAEVAAKMGFNTLVHVSVAEAVRWCVNQYNKQNVVLLVAGSLYLHTDVSIS
jgi:dihydrofolate synthase/folylpolyglutamate synthase